MKILKLYTQKNYNNCIKRIENAKLLPKKVLDLDDFINSQPLDKLRIWIKISDLTIADNTNYRSESNLLITLVVELFKKELDVENVELSDSEIIKLLKRFSKSIKYEYGHVCGLVDKKPKKYTILRDIEKSDVED